MRALAVAVVMIPAVAYAQPSQEFAPPSSVEPIEVPEADHPSADYKSPGTALALSLGTTAAGLGVWIAGASANNEGVATVGFIAFAVGPTVGHTYAGHTSS